MTSSFGFGSSGASPPDRLVQRFLKFVKPDPETGCRLWIGSRWSTGYGRFAVKRAEERAWLESRGVDVQATNRIYAAHRVAHALFTGIISAGLNVLHVCDNPACVATSHLFLGTQGDNTRDARAKGRFRGGVPVFTASDRHQKSRDGCRRYYATHREAHLANVRAYREANNVEINAARRARSAAVNVARRARYAANREQIRAQHRAHYAARKAANVAEEATAAAK